MVQKVDTLIVGAGVIGSSVAMHLAEQGVSDIRVIDFDLEGSLSSSELNAGGVRGSWINPINIEMAKTSIDYFASIADEVGYRPCGYLWLHTPERWEAALKAREVQVKQGWPVDVWDLKELQSKIPFIDKTENIAGALFGVRDGLINPNLLKNHYRNRAKKFGVVFEDRTLLREVRYAGDGSHQILASAEKFEKVMSYETKHHVLVSPPGHLGRSRIEFQAKRVINCAGPWAAQVAKIIGYTSPSVPVRRQVCIFDCRDVDLTPYGMIVDTSGVYFHPEATNGLAGFANHGEPAGFNYSYDGESFFNETIWPALYERSSKFERLKHLSGWAGLYEVSPDECAIIGRVEAEIQRGAHVYEAHSFSGHGVMHSYSAGALLAELIVQERFKSLDISPLSGSRFSQGKKVAENLII